MFHFFYSKCLFIYFKRSYTECHEIKTILLWNENTLHEAYISCKLNYIFKFCIMLYQLTGKFIHVIIELSLSFLSTSITIISITHLGKVLILSFLGYLQTFFFKTQHISLWNIRVSPRNKKRKKKNPKALIRKNLVVLLKFSFSLCTQIRLPKTHFMRLFVSHRTCKM